MKKKRTFLQCSGIADIAEREEECDKSRES